MTTNFIDLSLLPIPDAVETLDASTIVQQMLDELAAEDPALAGLAPSDPGYHTVQVCALREVSLRARINDAVRAALLTTSWGSNLEHHGALEEVERGSFEDDEGNVVVEADEDYKQRIFQAGRARGAGVRELYESKALDADPRVFTVLARSPSPAVVHIEWVPAPAIDPDEYAAIQAILVEVMTSFEVRMLADSVTVTMATAIDVNIVATLLMEPGPDPNLAKTNAESAVRAWGLLQRRSRYPLLLHPMAKALQVVGCVGAEITEPSADQTAPITAAYYRVVDVTLTTQVAPWLA